MCTLILAWKLFEGTPIAAAANRDEALGRPSSPPAVLDTDPAVVAPRDEEAGGTWIGYNEHGLFVAVTNRASDLVGERSRGLLVRDALAERSAADARATVERELDARRYAGFNLVLADADEATLLEWDGELRRTELDPGVHVVVNDGLDGATEKAAWAREVAAVDTGESADAWLDRVSEILRDHDVPVCVHGDGYGTRSSSLVTVDADGTGTYAFADGPPCETPYRPVEVPEGQL